MAELLVTSVKADPTIRTRLREELKRLNLTVEAAADGSGIPKGTLDNILSGRTDSMKDVHLSALGKAFPRLDIVYILTDVRSDEKSLTDDMRAIYQISKRSIDKDEPGR